MKRIFTLTLVLVLFFFYSKLDAQVYSEAPITIVGGKRYTDMFYVKFTSHEVLPTVTGELRADGLAISPDFPEIRGIFENFVSARNLSMEDIGIRKAIPRSISIDGVYTDPISGEVKTIPDLSKIYLVEFPFQVDVDSIINQLEGRPEVEYSHGPVQVMNLAGHTPNDPKYTDGTQWYLNAIDAPGAWEITQGDASIKIGVIESGGVAQQNHPDLAGNILTGGDTSPVNLHATQVAGFAGAITDNGVGIASLGWNTKILTYSFVNTDPNRQLLADKINEAVADGAKILNMSFKTIKTGYLNCDLSLVTGTPKSNENYSNPVRNNATSVPPTYYYNWNYPVVLDAITAAISQDNVVVVAGAGNNAGILFDGSEPCEPIPYPTYPANISGVIGVSASDQNGDFIDIFNYGSHVDINAPGGINSSTGLYTTWTGSSYGNTSAGTSFSAPQVAGLAALIFSIDGLLLPAEVEEIIENTADKVGQYTYDANGYNQRMGYGRINAYAAVLAAKYGVQQYLTGVISGNITQNTMLYGDVHVTGDLIVNSGVALVIKSGTEMKFDGGKKLRVYGTLAVGGTETLPVMFTRYAASGSWYGIRFENSSVDADCIIKYADIEYATIGTYIYYANPKIENNTFKNNTYGMYIYNSSPSVKTNEISQNSQYGIYMFGSQPYLYDNYIHNNSVDGIKGQFNSNPSLFNNSIKSNNNNGYYAYYYSSPEFGPTSGSAYGHNVVSGNGANGIYANYHSDPFLGAGAPWSTRAGGINTIENNTSYNVKAISTSDVWARYNWWGSSPPPASKFYSDATSNIQTEFYLSSALASGSSLGKTTGIPSTLAPLDTNSAVSLYDWGKELWLTDQLNESIGLYKILIRKFPNNPKARLGVVKISYLYRKTGKKGLSDYLSTIIDKGKDENLVGVTLDLLAYTYMNERNFDSAIQTTEHIVTRSPDTGSEYIALFNLFNIYRNELNDDFRAGEILSDLKEKYPDYELTLFAQSEMGEDVDWSLAKRAVPENISRLGSISIPTEYRLGENYPNPFNPVTQIDFVVLEDGFTRLVIYDLRGREVVRLIERDYSAGYHSVKWDGSSVASGLYFYRLQSGKLVQTKKMMLLK